MTALRFLSATTHDIAYNISKLNTLMSQGRMIYSIFILLFILSIQTDGLLWIYRKTILCNYNFKQKYPEDKNDYNTIAGFFNSSYIYYCPPEEVPIDNITYIVNYDKNGAGDFPAFVHIEFPPPKRECMYGVALLINPSIQDKEECFKYEFDAYDDSKMHSTERNMCVFKYDNQFVQNENNSTEFLYEDRIGIWFPYIFKGCYALRFHINHKQKYVVSNSVFLNTTYPRTEATKPQLICRYNAERREVMNFSLDISVSPDARHLLQVGLISQYNQTRQSCTWRGESFLFVWIIELGVTSVRKELTDQYCNVKFVKRVKESYQRIRCNFPIQRKVVNPCFAFNLIDERCMRNSIWKAPSMSKDTPCLWIQYCEQVYDHWRYVEVIEPLIQPDTLPNANSYLLPIIAIALIVSSVIGILCFRRYCIRKEKINLYVNPQNDDSNCFKSTDSGIINNSEKEIDYSNPLCDNIVLLYTNSSPSFIAFMKDFRKTLTKMCSCSVHDWHDGTVWNEVAKIGAVSWFTDLLNNEKCRVIWMDTPATRSVISNLRDNESNSDKLSKYYKIHDFRDMAFRGVLEVAKSKVNDVARQYRRHFIVRFEGLENTANIDDPFLDLSPHARYYMPQHLMQLCSDLSTVSQIFLKQR